MISKEEVLKIAKLSRLELAEEEVMKMQKDLSSILDYFDLLKKAPKLEKIKNDKLEIKNNLRVDEVISNREISEKIVAGFPDKQDNYLKVKSVL